MKFDEGVKLNKYHAKHHSYIIPGAFLAWTAKWQYIHACYNFPRMVYYVIENIVKNDRDVS